MKVYAAKGLFAISAGIAAYLANAVSSIVVVWFVLMLLDYLTGITGAAVRKELSSRMCWLGIVKKLSYLVLIIVCMLVDYATVPIMAKIDLGISFIGMITFLVTCWLIGMELLSILENLGEMGVKFPKFLKTVFVKFKEVPEKLMEDTAGDIVSNLPGNAFNEEGSDDV